MSEDTDTSTLVERPRHAKTGSGGRPWVRLDPKPAAVTDPYAFWLQAPPERSERCQYWLDMIDRGWRPNRSWGAHNREGAASQYGVYIWEVVNAIWPRLEQG